MPLFKIQPQDRSRKILTLGKSIEELISAAKEKLKLSDSEQGYMVVIEEDGTEIPDIETLEAYASHYTGPVTLMILEKNEKWTPKPFEVLSNSMMDIVDVLNHDQIDISALPLLDDNGNSKAQQTIAGSSKVSENEQPQKAQKVQDFGVSTSSKMITSIPWEKFPKRLLEACEKGLIPRPFDRRMMVQEIAQYLIDELKDESRSAVCKIVTKIIKKYPLSFVEKIGDAIVGNGEKTLTTAIYNRVNYVRMQKVGYGINKQKTQETDDDDKETRTKRTPSRKNTVQVDEYGCAEYEPCLPLTETNQSQEEKKKYLLEQVVSFDNRDAVKIKIMLEETYPSQRLSINHRDSSVKDALLEWPILCEPEYVLQHASILLGKPVCEIWRNNLKKNLVIHNFLKQYCISQKSNNRKETPQVQAITDVLTKSAQVSTDLENNSALVLAIFPLLISYFKEQSNFLYKIVDLEHLIDDEVQALNIDNPCPVLLVKGESLLDPMATCAVIIENKVCFSPRDILEGIFLTFLSYYIFALTYPDELFNTLEFIQRVIMDINPSGKGNKNKKGGKRRVGFGLAVRTLAEKLRQYDTPE